MIPPQPDGSKQVLLTDHRDGQCRAIVGYVDGETGKAMYCGEVTVEKVTADGRIIPTSWCPYHRAMYVVPFGKKQPSTFRSPSVKLLPPPQTTATLCVQCKTAFKSPSRTQVTCSELCRQRRKNQRECEYRERKPVRTLPCVRCGKPFQQIRNQVTCSEPCRKDQKRQIVRAWHHRNAAAMAAKAAAPPSQDHLDVCSKNTTT